MYTVRESIKDNIRQHINILELAQKAGMNEQYFKDGFKQVFGLPPYHYLEYERLKKAKELLKQPHLGMEAIGKQIGYDDASSFHRMFKRIEGVSPTEWRKKIGQ